MTVTKSKSGPPIADLYTKAEDTIGLHPEKIVFCVHLAAAIPAVWNAGLNDFKVFWQDAGKIHGRTAEITFEDDKGDPSGARQAAAACEQKDPFMLLTGLGFDVVPAVRKFVEDSHMLYYHPSAREDFSKRYSFSPVPSMETIGDLAAQWVGTRFKGKKVGIIHQESENWDPGRLTFVDRLKKLRSNVVVAQAGVTANQGTFFSELDELRSKGAEVVFVWTAHLSAVAIIQQAKAQRWSPQFLLPLAASMQTNQLGDQALDPPIHSIHIRPAYSPGDYSGPFASYAGEIKRFEAAYAKWRPDGTPSDVIWWVWLLSRDLHEHLVDCGRDCTRNKLVGLFLWRKYTSEEIAPSCPIDYTRNGHVGGFWGIMFTAYRRPNGSVGLSNIPGAVCRDSFLP